MGAGTRPLRCARFLVAVGRVPITVCEVNYGPLEIWQSQKRKSAPHRLGWVLEYLARRVQPFFWQPSRLWRPSLVCVGLPLAVPRLKSISDEENGKKKTETYYAVLACHWRGPHGEYGRQRHLRRCPCHHRLALRSHLGGESVKYRRWITRAYIHGHHRCCRQSPDLWL